MDLLKLFKKNDKSDCLPSVFVIDEAHALLYEIRHAFDASKVKYVWNLRDIDVNNPKLKTPPQVKRAPYNIFRRVFRMYTNAWDQIILITISTSGQISVLLPELKDDPSRRAYTSDKFMDNFILIQTYSANSTIIRDINAGMFRDGKYGVKNWMEFLESKFRKIEYFKFGRPLTYGYFQKSEENNVNEGTYDLEAKFKDCKEFWFMASKLFGGSEYRLTTNLSILYCMFNFAFGVNFLPPYLNREDLVEKYMMTLVEYTDENGQEPSHISGGFLPEGILNFISAKYFAQHHDSLSTILYSSIKYGFCDIGHFGEFLAQFFLLLAIFLCIDEKFDKVRKLAFQPVFLKEFLSILSGDKVSVDGFFRCNPSLEGSKISFGYFEHFPDDIINKPFDLMARCLFRGSAVTLNKRFPGIDLMIPLVLKKGDISFIGIQVKYVKERYAARNVRNALGKMKFSNIFEGHEGGSDRPFALVILALGKYKESKAYFTESSEGRSPQSFNEPAAFVIEGIPGIAKRVTGLTHLFDIAPIDHFYRGIDPKYLKRCDYTYDLLHETPQIESEDLEEQINEPQSDSTSQLINSEMQVDEPQENPTTQLTNELQEIPATRPLDDTLEINVRRSKRTRR